MGSSVKGGAQTVGYRYYVGMHLAIVHGPVDAITEIIVGERPAWSGSQTVSGSIAINKPDLFGGDEREGGVVGTVDVAMGEDAQGVNSYLQAKIGGVVPAFRGVCCLVLRQVMVAALNPYIKPWSIRAKHIPAKSWYSAKAEISGDANPAHILYEVLTNRQWGLGYNTTDLNDAAFRSAADALHAEAFGLSLLWSKEDEIENFLLEILKHIDAVLYVHPRTGLFVLKLIRNDYVVGSLLILDQTNIVEIESFERPAWGEVTNQVSVIYRDGPSNKDIAVTVQDLAIQHVQGGHSVPVTEQYPGIANGSLATQVAMRELNQLSTPLAKVVLVANRTAAALNIGDAFKLTLPAYGLSSVVMRVASIAYGTLTSSLVRIECVEDVFGLPASVYSDPTPTGWSDPVNVPAPPPYRLLTEAPYWFVVRLITGESDSLMNDLDPVTGFLTVQAVRPSSDAINVHIWTRQGAAPFAAAGSGDFVPSATLVAAIALTETSLALLGIVDLDLVPLESVAYVDAEALAVKSVDLNTNTVVVYRGVLDTVPAAHAAGARVWFADPFQGLIRSTEYVSGENVDVKLLSRTGKGTLSEASAPVNNLAFTGRMIRPYPPGNVKVNGAAYPSVTLGQLTVTWAHRDRTLQTATLIAQSSGNIGPEAGTTYTLRIYGENNTLVHTEAGLTGTSYTYPTATEQSESGLGRINDHVRLELEALRAGYISWQKQGLNVDRAGYGLNYGQYYGGI